MDTIAPRARAQQGKVTVAPHAVGQTGMRSGFVMFLVAKVFFIGTAYLVQLLLPRLFAREVEFGRFSAAMNGVAVLVNVVVLACVQTLSRQINRDGASTSTAGQWLRVALVMQFCIGAVTAGLLLASADFLATDVLLDASLASLIRMIAWVVLGYALYAPFVGFLNGTQRFATQSKQDIALSLLRVLLIVGAAAWSGQAIWSMRGLAMAAALMALWCFVSLGPSIGVRTGAPFTWRRRSNVDAVDAGAVEADAVEADAVDRASGDTQTLDALGRRTTRPRMNWRSRLRKAPWTTDNPYAVWMRAFVPLAFFHLCLNATFQLDLAALKRNVATLAWTAGLVGEAAADEASLQAAYYRGAQTFAFIPYQLSIALMSVLFPQVAKQAAKTGGASSVECAGDRGKEELAQVLSRGLRVTALFSFALAAPIAGSATGVMRVAYPSSFAPGADALAWLAYGMAFFCVFAMSANLLNALNHTRVVSFLALTAMVSVLGGNAWFTLSPFLQDLLGTSAIARAAMGTCAAMLCMMLLLGWVMRRIVGVWMSPLTVLRVGFASGIATWVSRLSGATFPRWTGIPLSGWVATSLALGTGFAAYGIILFLTRELSAEDLRVNRNKATQSTR